MVLSEESDYFGKPFVEFKERTSRGEDPLDVADDILTYVGEGSTRIVYGIPGNNDQVVKIVNTRVADHPDVEGVDIHDFSRAQKYYSNLWEADLEMQQKYPNVFPRTYETSPDGSWILSERVAPLNGDKAKFFELLGLNSQDVQNVNADAWEILIEMIKDYLLNEHDSSHYTHRYVMQEALDDDDLEDEYSTYVDDLEEPTAPFTPVFADSSPVKDSNIDDKPYGYETINRRIKAILSNPHHKGIIKAMAELGIPAREFTPKNVGISNLGGEHLVILDASLWSEK
tara:strand:+ start:425 stop:1279 length:855 start_codon:yes stop_codon:yes gene_type:complete